MLNYFENSARPPSCFNKSAHNGLFYATKLCKISLDKCLALKKDFFIEVQSVFVFSGFWNLKFVLAHSKFKLNQCEL